MELAKHEKIPVRVVLNRVSANSRLAQTIAAELPELAETMLGNRVLFAASLMEGRCATEVEPASVAAKEIKTLVNEIIALVADPVPAEEEVA